MQAGLWPYRSWPFKGRERWHQSVAAVPQRCEQGCAQGRGKAGLGVAREEHTFGENFTCTPRKSPTPKKEILDLEGHLQRRGQGALPGVSRCQPSHLIGRYSQVRLLHATPHLYY